MRLKGERSRHSCNLMGVRWGKGYCAQKKERPKKKKKSTNWVGKGEMIPVEEGHRVEKNVKMAIKCSVRE